ncbi:hypothetical protein BD413DRAFT_509737 [Trametes elegans]|nr:hypothetical protein BD413DRAFT_509737 [Trametes elegans]
MSLPLLRQARISQSLSAARRTLSRSRYRSTSSAHAQRSQRDSRNDDAPVPGPSSRQRSAKGSQPTVAASHDSPGPSETTSRVEAYLASINASGVEPTLEDLNRSKPHEQPPLHSPQYVQEYKELMNTLCRSFTKEQLRKFLVKAIGHTRGSHRKKVDYAESILQDIWRWPSLKQVEKAKRERTEVVTKNYPVTANELFLILGPDGKDLLRLSKDYDVHISLQQNPMALRVEGYHGRVQELGERIFTLKKGFIEDTYDLPSSVAIPQDMVQRISRLASAYIENDPSAPGKLRIFARDERHLVAAKRLASRAVHEMEETARTPLLTYLPSSSSLSGEPSPLYPHHYALFPHLSPRPLPFTMNTSGTFRLRRVGQWLTTVSHEEDDTREGLAGSQGRVGDSAERKVDLRDVLLYDVRGGDHTSTVTLKASMGHMLLTRPSEEQQATLIPPLTGDHSFEKIRQWITHNPVKLTFVPDIPLPLWNTTPDRQQIKHRLVYHELPSEFSEGPSDPLSVPPTLHRKKIISLELNLQDPTEPKRAGRAQAHTAERDLEEGLSVFDLQDMEDAQPPSLSPSSQAEPLNTVLDPSSVQCWSGVEADLNLMIPDRPMDLQFTVRSATVLPVSQQPPELQTYVDELRAYLESSESHPQPPSPPLLLEHAGVRYILSSNSSVRQSEEVVPRKHSGRSDHDDNSDSQEDVTRALCESHMDLETNQKSMHCEVTCEDVESEEAWRLFLRDCDRLSALRQQPKMSSVVGFGRHDHDHADVV